MQARRTQWWITLSAVTAIAGFSVANTSSVHAGVSPYQLTWQTLASGGILHSQDACYQLSGSVAQAVVDPEFSTTDTYTLFTGFWSAAPTAGQDQLFFNGFEDCTP